MGTKFTFAAASIALQSERENEDYAIFEHLERQVLDHTPTTLGEAAVMMELVAENLDCGPRSDERDIRALRRISAWLAGAKAPAPSKQLRRTARAVPTPRQIDLAIG